MTQGQQGLSGGPFPGGGGTIHLGQLSPLKPHSVATSVPREVAGVASDTETESVLDRRGGCWASWAGHPGLQAFAQAAASAPGTPPPLPT